MELSTRGSGATLRTAALTLGPPRRGAHAGPPRCGLGAPPPSPASSLSPAATSLDSSPAAQTRRSLNRSRRTLGRTWPSHEPEGLAPRRSSAAPGFEAPPRWTRCPFIPRLPKWPQLLAQRGRPWRLALPSRGGNSRAQEFWILLHFNHFKSRSYLAMVLEFITTRAIFNLSFCF